MVASTRANTTSTLGSLWRFTRGVVDRVVLIAAVLCAGALPSFIAQYRQRVGGMLSQVRADLAPYQAIAERFHGGSMQALIAHHRNSTDPTFNAESEAIESMLFSLSRLREAFDALDTDLSSQILFLFRSADLSIAEATWQVFQPAFTLSPANLLFALLAGFIVWLLFVGIWALLAWMLSPRER